MRFLKLTLAYEGTAYGGWQRQPNCVSIQAVLEAALRRITGEVVKTAASGRTDAGVHALGQVVSCATTCAMPLDRLQRAVNACLPADMCLRSVEEAPQGFHAIRDAIGKRYRYSIHSGQLRDIIARNWTWHVWHELDVAAMQTAAKFLIGTHDFASLQTAGSKRRSSVRTVRGLTIDCHETPFGRRIVLEVEADGFLYNMVRNIVGSLVEVGRGKHDASWMAEVLAARDRRRAGPTAPPQGLVLLYVHYP